MGDIFRELPLRYIGFSFGVAQAARYRFSPRTVDMCNAVGTIFVASHIVHTGFTEKAFPPVLNTVCFEGICSCIIPPLVNYYLCGFIADLIWDTSMPSIVRRWAPLVAGLLTIPILATFVDPEVDAFLSSVIS